MVNFNQNNEIPKKFSPAKMNNTDMGNGGQTQGGPIIPPKKPKKIDINRYKDPEGMTTQKMAIGLWYVEHRRIFVKTFIAVLLAISTVSWIYTFYHVIDYVAFGIKQDREMVAELVRPILIGHDYLVQNGHRALEFDPVQVLAGNKEGVYDFLAQVRNPNEKYYAKFDYYFLAGGKTYGQASGFILPGESKYLVSLAQETGSRPNESRLYVYNLSWSRVNNHVIPDWPLYRKDHLDISVSDIAFTPSSKTILTEKLPLNDLVFTATNNTAYNYKSVDFYIFLLRTNSIVGVNRYIMNSLMSGQTQNITMTWPGQFGRVDKVIIAPEIDITRSDIYLKFESE